MLIFIIALVHAIHNRQSILDSGRQDGLVGLEGRSSVASRHPEPVGDKGRIDRVDVDECGFLLDRSSPECLSEAGCVASNPMCSVKFLDSSECVCILYNNSREHFIYGVRFFEVNDKFVVIDSDGPVGDKIGLTSGIRVDHVFVNRLEVPLTWYLENADDPRMMIEVLMTDQRGAPRSRMIHTFEIEDEDLVDE